MLHDIPWELKCNASQARKIQTVTLKSRLSLRYVHDHDHAYLFLKPGSKKAAGEGCKQSHNKKTKKRKRGRSKGAREGQDKGKKN